MVKGYCMKDRQSVVLVNPSFELNKIGRAVAIGTCPLCKGKVYAVLKGEETPADLKAKALAFAAKKKGGAKSRKSRKSRKSAAKPAARRSRKSAGRRSRR